jgi:TonB family protein
VQLAVVAVGAIPEFDRLLSEASEPDATVRNAMVPWQIPIAVGIVGLLAAGGCSPGIRSQPTLPDVSAHCSVQLYSSLYGPLAGSPQLIPDSLVDSTFVRVSGPLLRYPRPQRDAGEQGWVIVAMVVAPDGSVADAKVMASSDRAFEPPALTVAAGSRYTRPLKDGKAVWAFICQPVQFSIVRQYE